MRNIVQLETADELTAAIFTNERQASENDPMLDEHDYIVFDPLNETFKLVSDNFCVALDLSPYDLLRSFGAALGIEVINEEEENANHMLMFGEDERLASFESPPPPIADIQKENK